jgi:arylsulfatase A
MAAPRDASAPFHRDAATAPRIPSAACYGVAMNAARLQRRGRLDARIASALSALALAGIAAAAPPAEDAAAASPAPLGRDAARPPNILLIVADDLGIGEVGAYGQQRIRTPHLDRLAEEGLLFERAYASSPVCAPSRASLLTGVHSGHAAIRGNREVGGWGFSDGEGQMPLASDAATIATMLQSRGYATGAFGKWGLGGPGTSGHPLNQGFDRFFGYLCQRLAHSLTPPYLWMDHDVHLLPENGAIPPHQRLAERPADDAAFAAFTGPTYAPTLILERALAFIDEHRDRPFLLYFPSPLPHLALQAPAEWVDRHPREWDPAPYLGERGYLPSLRPRATYAAMVSYLDHSVGRLVERIDSLGLGEDTLVVVTSDNGATWEVGGMDPAFFGSHAGLRGRKAQLYEGGLRVPLLARWSGRIAPGGRTAHRAALHDLKATVADLVGAGEVGGDGISMAPTLLGEGEQSEHPHLYFEFPEGPQSQAVIRGRHKAIRPEIARRGLAIELYDLDADPGESRDLAEAHPEIVAELAAIMDASRVPSREFPIPPLDARRVVPPMEGPLEAWLRPAEFRTQRLFDAGRFPTVAVATDGSVLAFWDGVQVRRSEDDGATFGPPIAVGPGVMGGGVIVDEVNGAILAFAEESMPPHAALRVFRSLDHGRTWHAHAISIEGNRDGNVPSMHTNEHGITLRHGPFAGRLIRATRWYAAANYPPSNFPTHYTDAIHSDDGGFSWRTSDPFPAMGTGEAAIVERADGTLLYNSRRHWAPPGENPRRRWTAVSRDGGQRWDELAMSPILPDGDADRDYGLMGGMVRLPIEGRDVLLFSNIESPSGRRNGTVWASFDGGATWPIKRVVDAGPFAYSSLEAGRPGTPSEGSIHLLYETGHSGGAIASFTLPWVLEGEATGDGELPAWLVEAMR